MNRSYFAVLLMVMFAPSCLVAQKNEVALTFGSTISPAAEGNGFCEACPVQPPPGPVHVGTGFAWQATFSRRVADFRLASLSLELPVAGTPSRSEGSFLSSSYSSTFFTPAAQLRLLPNSRLSPFASFGGGMARFAGGGTSGTTGALQFGGGVDFRTPLSHFALRAEGRDFVSGRPSSLIPLNNITANHIQHVFVGGGIVLKF